MSFTSGSTGGKYKHQLKINEMPSHTHDLIFAMAPIWTNAGRSNIQGSDQSNESFNFDYVKKSGEDVAHNYIQPYTVIYRWKRTA